jgi:hypothetical protein
MYNIFELSSELLIDPSPSIRNSNLVTYATMKMNAPVATMGGTAVTPISISEESRLGLVQKP